MWLVWLKLSAVRRTNTSGTRTRRLLVVTAAVVVLGPAGRAGADGYRVRSGDTLSGVALRMGVGQGSLAAANGIGDPDHIRAGQVLALPG